MIANLLAVLSDAGRRVAEPPAPPLTMEDAALALFSIAAQARAALFSVWAEEEEDGQVASGISVFFNVPDEPGTEGLLATKREPVRVPLALELYRPLGEAIAELAKRGSEAKRHRRGSVPFPFDAQDPGTVFRVLFTDGELGTWVTATARDRATRAAFPSFSELPLSREDAAFLEDTFFRLDSLFQGKLVVFSGERGSGRSTSLHAAMEALPDDVRGFAALETPRALDPRLAMVNPGSAGMVNVLRAFLRQDPDVVMADEARTPEELEMLLKASMTGHATAAVIEAPTPVAALARIQEAVPGLPVSPLIVHHVRDAQTGARRITVHRG
ncbi:Flp pilus assembly complex ATPase component TadA [Pyxidicoccus parkwayensis]|uniref:Flp pilus assembly complex ATPase component TadA n=1 Tax=Pyxidicoccus parkwayensis TaxID=2813578 RepID=A0ABX7NQS9_9BACT|nr:ATPase, T2SS/T4P/T4SS family [Pyxidicoccus parkwaysis]QSQ20751.1 Flp pilus assembly complex ATPase component TadA [Pyxidicoccus parkwaysis]